MSANFSAGIFHRKKVNFHKSPMFSSLVCSSFVRSCKPTTSFVSKFLLTSHSRKLSSKMEGTFTEHGVVPDVVGVAPNKLLKLTYGTTEITPGQIITPTAVKDRPTASFEAEADAFYTLIENDPDAPSREDPSFGEWNHWLRTNIPGSDLNGGDEMSAYVGSGPPEKTGLHRYVFLVFKQQGKQNFEGLSKLTNTSMDGRPKWKVREFAQKYNLGEPVAGNFFRAEWDDYVPLLYKQLGG